MEMDPQAGPRGAGGRSPLAPFEELDRHELVARVEALERRARTAEARLAAITRTRRTDASRPLDRTVGATPAEHGAHFGDLYYTVDRDWRLTYVNGPATARWGRSREELLGERLWEIFPEVQGSASHEMHLRAAEQRRVVRYETRSVVLERWVDVAIHPQRDGLAVWVRDIDDQKRVEAELRSLNDQLEERVARRTEALRAAKEEAERASAVKSRFLSTMSHELRTPLNAVIGLTDLMRTEVVGPMNARQKFQLTRIRASAWHLVSLIDEILTYARTEAGSERVRLTEVDVADIARGVVASLDSQASVAGIALHLDVRDAAGPPGLVVTDGGKLRQVLVNLVGNALKYADGGDVTVALDIGADEVTVHVRDTGPGIPGAWHERIFEPFVQMDQSTTRSYGGTGLGLAMSRRLARLLGGDVELDSVPGEGSTFTLRLPRESPLS